MVHEYFYDKIDEISFKIDFFVFFCDVFCEFFDKLVLFNDWFCSSESAYLFILF